jgi:AraC-like DNA-binding protein
MTHWERPAQASLAPYVEAVAFSQDDESARTREPIRVVPDGCIDVLFSLPLCSGAGTESERAEVFGLKTSALLIRPGPAVENVAIRFRPGAATRFLGASASATTDTHVELTAFWGDDARILSDRVARAPASRERAAAIEEMLLARLGAAERPTELDSATAIAVRLFQRSAGQLSVRDAAAKLGIGQRRLERAFLDRVGTSPKRFARILRFRTAYRALAAGSPQIRVALDAGYSDQAHLLRDFRELAGASPSQVFGRGLSDSSKTAA